MEISGLQIRAARALVSWSGPAMASAANVSLSSLRRVESGRKVIPAVRTALIAALECVGVEFIAGGARLKGAP